MLADVFLFHDEFDMLRCRGYELEGVVDRHIAIEGNLTMSGYPREYRLRGDEIPNLEVVRVDLTDLDGVELPYDINRAIARPNYHPDEYPYEDNWRRDWKQREGADALIEAMPDDAFVMYGDVDEIPRREVVAGFDLPRVFDLVQDNLIYSTKWTGGNWFGTVIGMKAAHFGTFPKVRQHRGSFPDLHAGGWHLTWFGGEWAVVQKAQAFAHGEVADDLDTLMQQYRDHIWPGGTVELWEYTGSLPRWIRDGLAPAPWENPE